MTWTAIVILLLVGILLITLEIVVLPGAIAGIVGLIMLGVGVWQSYATHGTVAGNIVLLVCLYTRAKASRICSAVMSFIVER